MNKLFNLLLASFFLLAIQGFSQKSDTLIIGYEISPPFIMEENESLHGPSFWLWERIARRHGIPFKLIELPLDGLLYALASGEIDFCASPLTITSNRLRHFDYSAPYYVAHSTILTREISGIERAVNFVASSLTVDRMSSLRDSLQDFRDQRLGTIENSATDSWLRDNFYTNKFTYSDMEQLIKALERDQIDAIAYDRPILQNLIQTDTVSRFRLENILFNPSYYGIGMNPELPEELKKEISISILEYTEGMDWKVMLSEYGLE